MVSVHPQSCSIAIDMVFARRPLSSSLYSVYFESHDVTAIDIFGSYFFMWCACHSRNFALSKFIFMSNLRKTKDKFPREHDMTYFEKNKLSLAT